MTTEPKTIDESPKITDTILFELETTNSDGDKVNPYKVDQVLIYFLARDFGQSKTYELTNEITDDLSLKSYYSNAQVIRVFGSDDFPAWLSSDLDNAFMDRVGTGEFELTWVPEFAREGDYIICWTWTPIVSGDKLSSYQLFHLESDAANNTVIPSRITPDDKYTKLLDRYLPEFCKTQLTSTDLTPDVLQKLNGAIAKMFKQLEDLANQMLDLDDSNVVSESLLVYLANAFHLQLRSNDPALWRRQIRRAVPLYKKKGTLAGLQEALAQAGIEFKSLKQLWQTISPYTWTEAFTVTDDQTEFELSRAVYDGTSFDLYIRYAGEDGFEQINANKYARIDYDEEDSVYILKWKGDKANPVIMLDDGDIVKVVYKLRPVVDEALEEYFQSLPLADQRDEAEVTYPPKNWNIRLIEEDDSYFSALIPFKNPFADPVIYGKIRTTFAYSENIYNMEEYNGSLRDSTDPCHLGKEFVDECSGGISSSVNLDVAIEDVSSSRIDEVREIFREYVPFHARLNNLNVQGKMVDFVAPQQERLEILINQQMTDTMVLGQNIFTRVMEDSFDAGAVRRNMLTTASTIATTTGTGSNDSIVLYSPGVRFDIGHSGLDVTNNYLEILSGPDAGEYEISAAHKQCVEITQGAPDTIAYPLNSSGFPFRLSNEKFSGSITSITQDNQYRFFDTGANFRFYGAESGWQVTVTSPATVAGTYTIDDTLPNDVLLLQSWPDADDRGNITYQLKDADGNAVGDVRTTAEIVVLERGLVDGGTDFIVEHQIDQGDYLKISGSQYLISEIVDDDTFYITAWTSGNIGTTAAKAYKRIFDNVVGYLDVRGMTLETVTDYEATLSITNGANGSGITVEDSNVKECYLVAIDNTYYQISEIDGTTITLSGPKVSWGLAGTSVTYSLIHFEKTQQTIKDYTFSFIDRRNDDFVASEQDVGMSMAMTAAYLGSPDSFEYQMQKEGISIGVEWR